MVCSTTRQTRTKSNLCRCRDSVLFNDQIAISTLLGAGEWKRKKHQPEYRRQWRKLHIGIDAETLQIRAVQLTTNNISDSQVLGDLLDERIDSVYTDGAYDPKYCR